MAKQIIARGQISIIDLNDAKSLHATLGANKANTQIYSSDLQTYTPAWTKENPLVITPELFVSGIADNQIDRVKKESVKYTINNNPLSRYTWAKVSPTPPYALTIDRNMEDMDQMKIQFSASYIDPDFNELETPIKAEIQFTKTTNAGSNIMAIGYYPQGFVFKNGEVPTLYAHCDMWRGSQIDNKDVTYQWYKKDYDPSTPEEWELLSESAYGCTGTKTNELAIPEGAVLNFETFKCVITDKDAKVATYNKTVECTFNFEDRTDPYTVDIYSTTGDKIINGVGSTTLSVKIWQAGKCFSETEVTNKFNLEWKKFDQDGVLDTNWRVNDPQNTKKAQSITVDASEITGKAVFICDVYTKN